MKSLPRKLAAALIGKRGMAVYRGYVRGFLTPPAKSYAQKGEDLIVAGYFDKPGYYLDIGCFHPKHISNTYLLHKAGWNGCAVDIDRHKTRLFTKARASRCQVLVTAIVGERSEEGFVDVYKFGGGAGWSDVDTLDETTARYYRDEKGFGNFTVEQVAVLGINELLAQLPPVNFLNIDVEGLDGELIDALDLARFPIEVVLFEDNEAWGGTPDRCEKFARHGYERLFVSGGSVAYAKPKAKFG